MGTVLIIHCAEGGRKALQRMTQLGYQLPADVQTFELPCTGRINEVLLMDHLEKGVRGIMVVGCQKENCTYLSGNLQAAKRVARVQDLLGGAEIDRSMQMVFTAPDEGKKLHQTIDEFYKALARGPQKQTSAGVSK